MDFIIEVLIPKDEIQKLNISESLVEWGGEIFSRNPPQYTNNSKLIFEQFTIPNDYKKLTENGLNTNNYIALFLKGSNHINLEFLINNQDNNIFLDELMIFIMNLSKISNFALLLMRDEEYIDKKYIIQTKEELINITLKCFDWNSPEGALIIKS